MSGMHGRPRGVGLATVGLGLAVWLALSLSPSAPILDAVGARPTVEPRLPTELPGFRADVWYLPADSMLGFVDIPEGTFTMGSDPRVDPLAFDIERWSESLMQGEVELRAFRIAKHEVTVAQYAAFVAATGHRPVDPRALEAPANHPVAWVSWTDAVAYTAWLDGALRASERTPRALKALLDAGWHVTLPTEAQWEKAARGEDARVFPWGHEPRVDRANFRASSTRPVGSFPCPECPYPVHDLSGNVWEWTRSPYQPYPYDPTDDRSGLESEALWVMRGGSFGDPEQMIRAANRGGADPGARRAFIGFRVALTRDGPVPARTSPPPPTG